MWLNEQYLRSFGGAGQGPSKKRGGLGKNSIGEAESIVLDLMGHGGMWDKSSVNPGDTAGQLGGAAGSEKRRRCGLSPPGWRNGGHCREPPSPR